MSNLITEFNRIRGVVFSQIYKDPVNGYQTVRKWLDNYYHSGALDKNGHKGLMAEVSFFEQNKTGLKLKVAKDVGDHTDFVGMMDGRMVSIDVTTNIGIKKIEEYKPFLKQGDEYKIAYFDGLKFDLIDVRLLSLRRCGNCAGAGFLVPFILMGRELFTRTGMATGEYLQRLCYCCPICDHVEFAREWRTPGFYPLSVLHSELSACCEDDDSIVSDVSQYGKSMVRHFRSVGDPKTLAIAEPCDLNLDMKHGDSIPGLHFVWSHPLVRPVLHNTECSSEVLDEM